MSNAPNADEIRTRILQAMGLHGADTNAVVPLRSLMVKLRESGLSQIDADTGIAALEADGYIEASPGGGSMMKVTEKGFALMD